ncbi:MAG: hypothetical protein WBP93_01910 [Pyrinomonadaceae bacterium]
MATKKATKDEKEHKVILSMPDMGLTTAQTNSLKKQFQNNVVESLGGKERLAARRIIVVIIIVYY